MTTIMTNKLTLPTPFPTERRSWTDPITGLVVPKTLGANLRWRQALLERAEKDNGYRQDLYTAASQSILFWLNAFGWTYRLFDTDETGTVRQLSSKDTHKPFITWEIQDQHIIEIDRAIVEGHDLLTDKARDMGATWNHLVVIDHKWIFESDRSFLLISRKESCVDSAGRKGITNPADPGTLFGKLDYLHTWLPNWMMPAHTRTTMHLVNMENGSRIDGESANATAGSSDRRTALLLDEMAKMAEGESIKRSTRDVTACRLANSTPYGPGTAYTKWYLSGTVKIFGLSWWEHPEKGRNREIVVDPITGIERIESPWHRNEAAIRTPKELAQEVDRNHLGSGEQFFEPEIIAKHRHLYVREPIGAPRSIAFDKTISPHHMPTAIRTNRVEVIRVQSLSRGPWKFWFSPIDGRPDQAHNYIFGIDIGKGMKASNSVISVGCVDTQQKIAEFASALYSPYEFAYLAAAAAVWFGGAQRGNRPLIIWESNGDPGIYFSKVLVRDLKYPHCYLDRYRGVNLKITQAKHYGWHSTPEKKSELLGDYRRALAQGTIQNPSEAALAEAESYIYLPGGQIGPAELQFESANARKTHGDRPIADALMYRGMLNAKVTVPIPATPPHNSFGQRYTEWEKSRRGQKRQRTWDFRTYVG